MVLELNKGPRKKIIPTNGYTHFFHKPFLILGVDMILYLGHFHIPYYAMVGKGVIGMPYETLVESSLPINVWCS